MGGFRSPLFLLGIGAGAAQAGIRSPLAPWLGGACAPAAVERPGIRSMLAPWLGGACAVVGTPIPVPGSGASGNGTILAYLLDQKKNLPPRVQNDDEEVMDFIRMWTIWYSNQ